MRRARGYAPFETSDHQDAVLDRIVERAVSSGQGLSSGQGALAVFDLDGCLFDTRWRQVQILREIGSARGWTQLYRPAPEHFLDWDLRGALLRAGLDPVWVDAHYTPIRAHWFERFFAPDSVAFDHAMPGAAAFVTEVARHARIVYLTGRHEAQRAHTMASLARFGFPIEGGAHLELQPANEYDYTTYKGIALSHISQMGRPVLFLDNEPSNANLFRERFPDSLVVFVETDHSDAPIEPHADIPWIRGFLRTGV